MNTHTDGIIFMLN